MQIVRGAIRRCTDKSDARNWPRYGGRGISVCAEWTADRRAFADYIRGLPGADDPRRSLDRIDNDRGYEPGNLRWATPSEQLRNQGARRPHAREDRRAKAIDRAPAGSRFGRWTVLGHEHREARTNRTGRRYPPRQAFAHVRCDCGREALVSVANLVSSHSTQCMSCGARAKLERRRAKAEAQA